MGKEESVENTGFKIFNNNRNREGGGVLIGVREELGRVAVELKQENETHEALWVKIDNGKIKISDLN